VKIGNRRTRSFVRPGVIEENEKVTVGGHKKGRRGRGGTAAIQKSQSLNPKRPVGFNIGPLHGRKNQSPD